MLDKELQRSALVARNAQLGNFPLQSGCIHHHCSAGGGRRDAGDIKIGIEHFVNHDIGRARLGNVLCKIRKQLFQIFGVRSNGYMGSVRIGCPIIQNADIDPVGSDQPDAVNDDAGRSCRRRNRGRRSPVVVFPSVNMTITFAFVEDGSKS